MATFSNCPTCGQPVKRSDAKYCSRSCIPKEKKFDPSKEELQELVWAMPTTHVAAMYGVSDKSVEKRCKKLNIPKPPRGYWTKEK
jgi:predicted nucleic acid-binding Zn ribbon protein